MASDSFITLKDAVTPEDVEQAFADINGRRFEGRMVLQSPDDLAKDYSAARAWILEAPGTRPKTPGPTNPDEDLGFCFWLDEGCRAIGVRHVLFNAWIRWVQHVFTHELARHFKVRRFDGGDGTVKTDPERYKSSLQEFALYAHDLSQPRLARALAWVRRVLGLRRLPLAPDDADFLEWHYLRHVPEGWR